MKKIIVAIIILIVVGVPMIVCATAFLISRMRERRQQQRRQARMLQQQQCLFRTLGNSGAPDMDLEAQRAALIRKSLVTRSISSINSDSKATYSSLSSQEFGDIHLGSGPEPSVYNTSQSQHAPNAQTLQVQQVSDRQQQLRSPTPQQSRGSSCRVQRKENEVDSPSDKARLGKLYPEAVSPFGVHPALLEDRSRRHYTTKPPLQTMISAHLR